MFFQTYDTETFLGCQVLSANETVITCVTPAKTSGIVGPADVVVQGRLIEDSVCEGTACTYTYSGAGDQSVVYQNVTVRNGQVLTVTGVGFTLGSAGTVSLVVNSVAYSTTVVNDTSLNVTVPNTLIAGAYTFFFNIDGYGLAGFIDATVSFNVDNQTTINISQVGEEITLTGSGFDQNSLTVSVGGVAALVRSVTPNSITVRVPQVWKNQNASIDVLQNGTTLSCYNCIQQLSSMSPGVYAISAQNTSTPDAFTIGFSESGGSLLANNPTKISAYLELTLNKKQYASTGVVNKVISFANVPTGVYTLFIHLQGYGYTNI